MASCESCVLLPRVWPFRYTLVPLLTGTVAVFQADTDALGEFVLSAMLMPAVSPNMFATFAFLRAVSVVCHSCFQEKCVMLFLSMLYCVSSVVSWDTRLA